MKLIQCRFSSGQRVPLLVQDGLATPLPKLVPFIDEIAAVMDVHPVSLLLYTYALRCSDQSIDQILCRVRKELSELS